MSDKFEKHLQFNNPEINVSLMLEIFEDKIGQIQKPQGTEGMKFPLECDLNKAIFAAVLSEYLKIERK